MDYITLGPVPKMENMIDVVDKNSEKINRCEVRAYSEFLKRKFPMAQIGIETMRIGKQKYSEVVVRFNGDSDERSSLIALSVADNIPSRWDRKSLSNLNKLLKGVNLGNKKERNAKK